MNKNIKRGLSSIVRIFRFNLNSGFLGKNVLFVDVEAPKNRKYDKCSHLHSNNEADPYFWIYFGY